MASTHWLLSSSERCYRWLLLAYPSELRQEFGTEMLQTFRDCCQEELHTGGISKLASFWGVVVSDFVKSVCVEHIISIKKLFTNEKDFTMITPPFQLRVAQLSDVGLTRPANEDNMISVIPENTTTLQRKGALFIVADGMGGHDHGEVASELAVNSIRETYYQDLEEDISTSLVNAVLQANKVVYRAGQEKSSTGQQSKGTMGTTVVAAVLHEKTLYVANAGDSLAYVMRNKQVNQVAEDHTWVNEQIRSGKMTEEEALKIHQRNVITRSLGSNETLDVYHTSIPVEQGDSIVLCTDGLHALVNEQEMLQIVETYTPEESAKRLVEQANANGGTDNITAIVINVA